MLQNQTTNTSDTLPPCVCVFCRKSQRNQESMCEPNYKHKAHHLTNKWCRGHFLGYTPKVVPPSQSNVIGCACLQSLHIHHISLSSDVASSEGRALCADLGSEHKGGVTGVFQEHSNTSTAPSGGLIRSHCHWLHGDVGRDCRGEGELMKHVVSTNT